MRNVLTIVVSVLLLTGCYDFLTEEPRTEISLDEYFERPEDARSAVNALYRSGYPGFFTGGVYSGSYAMRGGYMSGLFDNEYKGQEVHVQNMHDLTLDPINMSTYFGNQWESAYHAISRANTAIQRVPTVEGINAAEERNLLAQARFFRALNYFFLTKTWGDVPLVTEPYDSLDDIYVSRDDQGEVYSLIRSDLEWALENGDLGNGPFAQNNFRVTQGAVRTLLADVNLNMAGYPMQDQSAYARAADAARDVIHSGIYDLISHGNSSDESAYNVLRTSDDESEYIYAIEFETGISENGAYPAWSYPVEYATRAPVTYTITNNAYAPLDQLINVYDSDRDLRIQEQQFFHTQRVVNGELYEFERSPYLFHDTEALYETNRGDKNINVYRYAEALLIAAEAIARSEGVTGEAVQYLADVRSRAYWETDRSEIVSELSGLSEQAFVEEVWAERLREFMLEFKIWGDVQRTRQFPVTTPGSDGEVNFTSVIGHQNEWGHTFSETHLLFPIPDTELQRNPELEQNPGY